MTPRAVVAILCSLTLLFAIAAYVVAGPVIPPWTLTKVQPGMTSQEVEQVLGSPQHRDPERWDYERWGTIGWVEVHFNENRVVSVNDESAIRIP